MLDVKEAVKASFGVFQELFPASVFRDPRLEEVVLSEDDHAWKVTMSYKNPDFEDELTSQRESTSFSAALGTPGRRVPTRHYKSVSINAIDGSFLGVRSA